MKLKKYIQSSVFLFLMCLICLLKINSVQAQSATDSAQVKQGVTVHIFTSKTCPHCLKEKRFLKDFLRNNTQVTVYDYQVEIRDNAFLMSEIGQQLDISSGGVPLTVIGTDHITGFSSAQSTGRQIIEIIDKHRGKTDSLDLNKIAQTAGLRPQRQQLVPAMDQPKPTALPTKQPAKTEPDPLSQEEIQVPLLGTVKVESLSLPILTLLLGFLDGFNPCAMWTLLFLISLLLGMKDKRRMW
ncbi:MAG: hypothetical protein GF381_01170, partial [Candidatus Pacebacteria bacterium]|nr:hypothetical protein [Candidatus Paceibacterota bacterium]